MKYDRTYKKLEDKKNDLIDELNNITSVMLEIEEFWKTGIPIDWEDVGVTTKDVV